MELNDLFNILDVNKDGALSRSDLHDAAKQLGWHWPEAPLLAVFDLLSLLKPISRNTFISCMNQILQDPLGPYGRVLLNAPHFAPGRDSQNTIPSADNRRAPPKRQWPTPKDIEIDDGGVSLLERTAGADAAHEYQRLLDRLPSIEVSRAGAALLIIDPQRSFTKGAWMRSIGARADVDIKPIKRAFENCARHLEGNGRGVETMFTRCPFPPDSYGWDDSLAEIIGPGRLYFIKPGNSVLFPPTNGFREWAARCIDQGKNVLVMGGCTLNSCVRVSSIETQKQFKDRTLQVVVDLNMSGARLKNYQPSPAYDGRSAVESAVREMEASGVRVARRVQWT
ncbi:MAG: hypothetical protein GY859_33215 [Desulfobacterales bacterium]|nr:hypothetical protein [Desulfobacterales bacterium]